MTTALDLVNRTKRYLLSSHREILNTLLDPITTTTQTSITFNEETQAIAAGAYLSVDLEIMYVWSMTNTTTAIVQRGMLGSVAATHLANALVTVNPKFPEFSILEEINADLADLSGLGLYKAVTVDFTYIAGRMGYELDVDDVLGGLDVHYDYPGITHDWPRLSKWEVNRETDTTEFPSGFSITLHDDAYSGRDVRVTLAVPYSPLTALTSDVETVAGLQPSAVDLPPLGAALRLQNVREGQRNFNEAQGDSRRASEVPAGAQLTSTQGLRDSRMRRIMSEKTKLTKMYPYRRLLPS